MRERETYLVNADTGKVVPLLASVAADHIILVCSLAEAVEAGDLSIFSWLQGAVELGMAYLI